MRVLLAPVYDMGAEWSAEGDSQYGWARTFVEDLVRRGHFVYWTVLDRYVQPDLKDLHGVKVLPFGHPTSDVRGQHVLRYTLPEAIFQQFASPLGPSFCDVVITNDAYYGLLLQQYFCTRRWFDPTPIVLYDNYPTIVGWPEQTWMGPDGDESCLFARALGYGLCETVGCSPYVSARTLELVQAYAPPALAKRFADRRQYVMNFVDTGYHDRLPPVPKYERFSLYVGGRFTATKGGEQIVRQYLRFLMAGRDVDIHVTAVGSAKRLRLVLKEYGARDALYLYRNLEYAACADIMRRCHVAMFYQLNPGAGAPYEWLYNDLVVLFRKHDFPEELEQLPPGYPFWFRTEDEGAALLRWVYENYAEARGQLEEIDVKGWCRREADELEGNRRMIVLAEERLAEARSGLHAQPYDDDTMAHVTKALESLSGDGPVPMRLLLEGVNRVSGRPIVARTWGEGIRGVPPLRIYRHLIPSGWRDDCQTEIPRYVRRET